MPLHCLVNCDLIKLLKYTYFWLLFLREYTLIFIHDKICPVSLLHCSVIKMLIYCASTLQYFFIVSKKNTLYFFFHDQNYLVFTLYIAVQSSYLHTLQPLYYIFAHCFKNNTLPHLLNVVLWFLSVFVHLVLTFYYIFRTIQYDTVKKKITNYTIFATLKLFCHWPIGKHLWL